MNINKQVTLGEKKCFLRKGLVPVRVAKVNSERKVLSRRKAGGSSADYERVCIAALKAYLVFKKEILSR